MTALSPQASIAIRLIAARETLQNLWGASYGDKIMPWREVVRELAGVLKCPPILVPVCLPESERPDNFGMIALLAAALDETEHA